MDAAHDATSLPPDLAQALAQAGIAARDEAGLRDELERRIAGFTLIYLPPAARHRWKCRYRLLLGSGYLDSMTAAEAYARALVATLASSSPDADG